MLRVNHPVPVTDLYVDLNILQRVSSDFSFSDWRREDELDWRSFDRLGLGRVKRERVPATEKIRECRKLTILGKPGSGKTTLLKSLATACIAGKLGWDEPEAVPVFITLREFAEDAAQEEGFSLRDAISQQFDRWGFAEATETILQQGRALILLDGLDEVPSYQSDSVIRQICGFCRNYADNRFIITCRTQSLKFHFEGFTEAEIADLAPEQVKRFIQNWFAIVVGSVEASELAAQLKRQLQQNKPIAELAVTPILLNLTCSVFRDERDELPKRRSYLYEKGLRDLLQRLARPERVRHTGGNTLTLDDKLSLLEWVAYTLFKDNDYFPERRKLKRLIANHLQIQRSEAQQVLRSLEAQHGLIIERSEARFSFSHLTFQEYFTACYIGQDESQIEKLVTQHLTEEWWQEVFLLVAELISDEERLLQLMENAARKCVNTPRLQALLTWAAQMASGSDSNFKPAAKRFAALILPLALPLSSIRDLSFNRVLGFYIDLAKDRKIAIDLATSFASSRARVRAVAKATNEAYARFRANNSFDYDRNRAFDPKRTCDPNCSHALDLARNFEKLKTFKDINFTRLIAELKELEAEVPDQEQPRERHRQFAERFNQIWLNTIQLNQEWVDLSKDEVEALSK